MHESHPQARLNSIVRGIQVRILAANVIPVRDIGQITRAWNAGCFAGHRAGRRRCFPPPISQLPVTGSKPLFIPGLSLATLYVSYPDRNSGSPSATTSIHPGHTFLRRPCGYVRLSQWMYWSGRPRSARGHRVSSRCRILRIAGLRVVKLTSCWVVRASASPHVHAAGLHVVPAFDRRFHTLTEHPLPVGFRAWESDAGSSVRRLKPKFGTPNLSMPTQPAWVAGPCRRYWSGPGP